MSDITSSNPLTNGHAFADDVTDKCRAVLEFVSFTLPAITGAGASDDVAYGARLTLDLVTDALKEIAENKLPWSG